MCAYPVLRVELGRKQQREWESEREVDRERRREKAREGKERDKRTNMAVERSCFCFSREKKREHLGVELLCFFAFRERGERGKRDGQSAASVSPRFFLVVVVCFFVHVVGNLPRFLCSCLPSTGPVVHTHLHIRRHQY